MGHVRLVLDKVRPPWGQSYVLHLRVTMPTFQAEVRILRLKEPVEEAVGAMSERQGTNNETP